MFYFPASYRLILHFRDSKNCRNELRRIVKAHSKPRIVKKSLMLPDLETTVDDTAKNVALEIAKHLNEPKTELIGKIIIWSVRKRRIVFEYNVNICLRLYHV